MACTANKAPLLRIIATRGYAAQASPKPAGQSSKVQTTTLPNKLVVASAESQLPISRVSIIFRAGSRNEEYSNKGASHIFRLAAGLSTKNSSGFSITRNIQQIGGRLTATSDRELLTFTVETTPENLETGIRFLEDVATVPVFKPWELSDIIPRLRYELVSVPREVRAVELVHKAAFRNILGNSIFCPKYQIGNLSPETLLHYFCQTCRTNRCAVVGVGVDHNLLAGYAQNLSLDSGEGNTSASKYYGGTELRKDRAGNVAHIAIAGEGGSLKNLKEALAFSVLQRSAGIGPVTKRGANNGALTKVISGAVGTAPITVSSINANYSDSGLFGFVITTDAQNAGKAVEAGVKALKSGSISADDFNRGKAALKASILRRYESDANILSDIGSQAALLGTVENVDAILSLIESISQSDVQAAAKKVGSSKLSMGAVGNLSTVPYLSDLA